MELDRGTDRVQTGIHLAVRGTDRSTVRGTDRGTVRGTDWGTVRGIDRVQTGVQLGVQTRVQ
jgi:hypothetical protein